MITNSKVRHHAIVDDFIFISADLISIYLHIYFYIVIEKFKFPNNMNETQIYIYFNP